MNATDLARKLIAATPAERSQTLTRHAVSDAEQAAAAIRLECVRAWASDPKRVRACAKAIDALEMHSPAPLVAGNGEWVRGIAAITRGKFERAVDHLRRAGELLVESDHASDAANSRVALLLALAMLGRYDEAIEAGLSAIPILEKGGDELAAGKVEMNLSNIVSRRGDHALAGAYCARARDRFKSAKEPTWQAMAENGLANTAAEGNEFEKAERFYKIALSTAETAGMNVTEAEIVASMGNLALLRGRYADALRHLETSRRKFEALAMPHQSAIAELEIADIYAELNLNAEAAEIYERVCASFRTLKLRAEEARSRLNHGRALTSLARYSEAEAELARSGELYSREKNFSGRGAAILARARVAFQQKDFSAVLAILADAKALVSTSRDERLAIAVELLLAETYLSRQNTKRARAVLATLLTESRRLRQVDAVRNAQNLLGRAALLDGDTAAAARFFRQSIGIVEKLRAPLASEEFSMAFLAARLEPYENLARLYLSEGKFTRAFATIESARSRALADALGSHDGEGGSTDPRRIELARVREELNSIYKRLDRGEEEDAETLRRSATQREDRIGKLMREIDSLRTSATATRSRFDLATLHAQLGKSRTLIEFVEIEGMLSAFYISAGKIKFFRDIASSDEVGVLLEELRFQFETLRYGNSLPPRFADQTRSRSDAILTRLYEKLIRPLADNLVTRSLVIVPVGVLHYVPFAALFDGERYLVERCEIVSAPSAAVWSKLHGRRRRKVAKSLLVGFADEKIPLVDAEIAQLRRIVPSPKVLTGEKATLSSFAKSTAGRDLIHLACHGQFRTDNPMFSSLHLADGWITVRDLVEQRLDAEVVTLSACETGVNRIHAGDELLGLARGFLSAGAASVIVTLWRVNDEATMRLMTDLYKGIQRGSSVSASLKIAQKLSVARGESPFYWSPFVCIGR